MHVMIAQDSLCTTPYRVLYVGIPMTPGSYAVVVAGEAIYGDVMFGRRSTRGFGTRLRGGGKRSLTFWTTKLF